MIGSKVKAIFAKWMDWIGVVALERVCAPPAKQAFF